MVEVIFGDSFKKNFKKIKDNKVKQKLIKQISKIRDDPDIGKPMKYTRKGTRELYIKPFRLSYYVDCDTIYILALYHKDKQ